MPRGTQAMTRNLAVRSNAMPTATAVAAPATIIHRREASTRTAQFSTFDATATLAAGARWGRTTPTPTRGLTASIQPEHSRVVVCSRMTDREYPAVVTQADIAPELPRFIGRARASRLDHAPQVPAAVGAAFVDVDRADGLAARRQRRCQRTGADAAVAGIAYRQ